MAVLTFQKEDLENLRFEGTFRRNLRFVKKDLAQLDKSIARSGETGESAELRRGFLEDLDEYTFSMYIFRFNQTNGLFVAEAEDQFGHSGIVGRLLMRGEDIADREFPYSPRPFVDNMQFIKSYIVESPETIPAHNPHAVEYLSFRRIFYLGTLVKSTEGFVARGKYFPAGSNSSMSGLWEMNSV